LLLSIHSSEPAYLGQIQEAMDTINGWVTKFGIRVLAPAWIRRFLLKNRGGRQPPWPILAGSPTL